MALDGGMLHCISKELTNIIGARVDKIFVPSRDEILITLRTKSDNLKLLISANATNARIHFTNLTFENPKEPPMLCMLLRKHLSSGRLLAVRQLGMDRILYLDFEATNELYDKTIITLAVEIMGRHSNVIIFNQDGIIIDALKRVSDTLSSVRRVLPGIVYIPPPLQDKQNIITIPLNSIITAIKDYSCKELNKAILCVIDGVSPLVANELALQTTKGNLIEKDKLSNFYYDRLYTVLDEFKNTLDNPQFTMLLDNTKPKDFTFIPLDYEPKKTYQNASAMLDEFFTEKDQYIRMRQRSTDLLKILVNATERTDKKLKLQAIELEQSSNRDKLREFGDILNANINSSIKGAKDVTLYDFYNDCDVTIPLDPRFNIIQNATRYYQEYKKAAKAETMLTELILKGEQELIYLDSVFDAVSRTNGESELTEIRIELQEQGYLKAKKTKAKPVKPQPPLQFTSSDGFAIQCGRNNKQNDLLTFKIAKNYDMWLHVKDIAGSHVIITSDNRPISDIAINEAAIIAAKNSKACESNNVAIDYTLVKYVKKPSGAKPGMVIFTNNRTINVRL